MRSSANSLPEYLVSGSTIVNRHGLTARTNIVHVHLGRQISQCVLRDLHQMVRSARLGFLESHDLKGQKHNTLLRLTVGVLAIFRSKSTRRQLAK